MRRTLIYAFISVFLLFAACTRDTEVIVKNTGNNPEMVLGLGIPLHKRKL